MSSPRRRPGAIFPCVRLRGRAAEPWVPAFAGRREGLRGRRLGGRKRIEDDAGGMDQGRVIDGTSGVVRLRSVMGRRQVLRAGAALGTLAAIAAPRDAGAATSVCFVGFPEYEAAL